MSNDKFIPLQRTVFTEVDLVHAITSAYKSHVWKISICSRGWNLLGAFCS